MTLLLGLLTLAMVGRALASSRKRPLRLSRRARSMALWVARRSAELALPLRLTPWLLEASVDPRRLSSALVEEGDDLRSSSSSSSSRSSSPEARGGPES